MDGQQVDAIEMEAVLDGRHVRIEAKASPGLELLGNFLQLFGVADIDIIAAGVRAQTGFGTDYAHVSYGDDGVSLTQLDSTEPTELVPPDAFERFIARLLWAAVDAATAADADVIRQAWWPRAQDDATAIVERAYPSGFDRA